MCRALFILLVAMIGCMCAEGSLRLGAVDVTKPSSDVSSSIVMKPSTDTTPISSVKTTTDVASIPVTKTASDVTPSSVVKPQLDVAPSSVSVSGATMSKPSTDVTSASTTKSSTDVRRAAAKSTPDTTATTSTKPAIPDVVSKTLVTGNTVQITGSKIVFAMADRMILSSAIRRMVRNSLAKTDDSALMVGIARLLGISMEDPALRAQLDRVLASRREDSKLRAEIEALVEMAQKGQNEALEMEFAYRTRGRVVVTPTGGVYGKKTTVAATPRGVYGKRTYVGRRGW